MLKNVKMLPKLIGSFSIVALIVLIIGIVGYSGISSIFESLEEVSTRHLPSTEALQVLNAAQMEINGIEKLLLIPEVPEKMRAEQYARFEVLHEMATESIINDVNDIVSNIATAVEEQSVTTREVANNITQASDGIQEVTQHVAQSSIVATSIAEDIAEVNQASVEISNSSSQVNMSADELNKLAEQLREMVSRFNV